MTDATEVARSVTDPVARKLIEWAILRAEDDDFSFDRYAAFIAANPELARHHDVPAQGRSRALAGSRQRKHRAQLSSRRRRRSAARDGSRLRAPRWRKATARLAQQYMRETWRNDALGADLETQVLDSFGPLLTGGDHKIRMDRRFYSEDTDGGMRAAQRLGGAQLAIAKARKAVIDKSSNAKALLDAVPEDARRDAGYMFSRIQWLRRNEKFDEAAQLMLAAPVDPAAIIDTDEWWQERRLLARKLLDTGEVQTRLSRRARRRRARPRKMPGSISSSPPAGSRCATPRMPAAANQYFAQIAQGGAHPTSLARAAYWQGRTAEALGRHDEARTHYARGAQYPAAYYGQLARARLGGGEISLPPAPEPAPDASGDAGAARNRARRRNPLCDRRARSRGLDRGRPRRPADRPRRACDAGRGRDAQSGCPHAPADRQRRDGARPAVRGACLSDRRPAALHAASVRRSSRPSPTRSRARKARSIRKRSRAPMRSA